MFLRNLRFALRQVRKNLTFSIVNVLGLALSMVACLLIFTYVTYERSYDQHIENADQVFRIYRIEKGEAPDDGAASVFPSMSPVIKSNLPEVEEITRVISYDKIYSSFAFSYYPLNDKVRTFNISEAYFVDNDALKIFSMNWLEGSGQASLDNPNELVISQTYKELFFGNTPAIGEVLRFKNTATDFIITGVFEDIPDNTHFNYDVLLSISSLPAEWNLDNSYGWGDFFTYLKLNSSATPERTEYKINEAFVEEENAWFKDEGVSFKLQNIRDIHLTSHHSFEIQTNGNEATVVFLSIVGVFIMIIAWVNYINLSTAKLIDRTKEVGIRKVLGGVRSQLIGQFLIEGIVLNVLSILVALTILQFSSGQFSDLLGIEVDLFALNTYQDTLLRIGLFTLGSLLFALYPAWMFSKQKIVAALKGTKGRHHSGIGLRRALSVFQNIIALILILGTLAVKGQLEFMQNQSIGMNIDQTLIVKKPFVASEKRIETRLSFLNDLKSISQVKQVARSSEIPGHEIGRMRFVALGPGKDDKALFAKDIAIDEDFIGLYDIEVLHGRSFDEKLNDESSIILSLKAAKSLLEGDLANWIDRTIYYDTEPYKLVGIVNDISQESLKSDINAHIYTYHNRVVYYSIKLETSNLTQAIANVEAAFHDNYNESYFEYFFLDDYFNRQYKSDRLFGRIFSFFSVLAIVITTLGLFGLSLYNISKRAKEVSVRKVLVSTLKISLYYYQKTIFH